MRVKGTSEEKRFMFVLCCVVCVKEKVFDLSVHAMVSLMPFRYRNG